MKYARMPIEVESQDPLQPVESTITDRSIADLGLTIPNLTLLYGEHRGSEALRSAIVAGHAQLVRAMC
jgi:hypothetical protein